MRIALLNIGQETNDFNPQPTTLADYRSFGLYEGQEMLVKLRGLGEVGGYLEAIEESGLEVETIPIIRGWASAAGRLDTPTRLFFEEKIRSGLEAAGRIDGLAIQLHGACAADGMDDVEGAHLALCRAILGPDVPIVLSLDHHANVTKRMVENADAIVGHRTQPHQPFETGKIAAQILLRMLQGEVRPTVAMRKLRLLSHQEQFLTSKAPMKTWFDRAREMERDPRVLQASPFPMQPWLDVAEGGWAVVVTTDGDAELAGRLADELADLAWSMRAEFQKKDAVTVDEAVRRADAMDGLVILSDTGDTVFGGAAGDSNLILESILRQGIKGRALVPMIAPTAVARLAEAGVGAEVTLPLGGHATGFFEPLTVTGTVRAVGGGVVKVAKHNQLEVDQGQAVIFEIGPVTMLLTELRAVAGNLPEAYRALGVRPEDYQMVVLKTASNFQYFQPIASGVIRVDTKGPGQSDIATLPWQRQPRPVYPLDEINSWRG